MQIEPGEEQSHASYNRSRALLAAVQRKAQPVDCQNARTRIQPDQSPSLLPVAARGPVQVEAHQRSPTLMAGETPGSQGGVRIWAPSRKKLWICCIGFGSSSALMLAAILLSEGRLNIFASTLFIGFVLSVRALRRPCYVTTDEEGIGITTRKSSLALRWNQIITATRVPHPGIYDYTPVQLQAPCPVEMNLTGYPRAQQHELFELIKLRANLLPHPARPTVFVKSDQAPSDPFSLMGPASADIREKVVEGHKIAAVRLYRDRRASQPGVAAQAIDWLDLNLEMLAPHDVLQARIPDPELYRELRALLYRGQYGRAIKRLRKQTGLRKQVASDTINLLGSVAALSARDNLNALEE
ncbi:MAG: hypothetical protein LC772_05465 [Chloroflexi bacterium]|nr:hypothetical protein [Chloroflexota bacterium]